MKCQKKKRSKKIKKGFKYANPNSIFFFNLLRGWWIVIKKSLKNQHVFKLRNNICFCCSCKKREWCQYLICQYLILLVWLISTYKKNFFVFLFSLCRSLIKRWCKVNWWIRNNFTHLFLQKRTRDTSYYAWCFPLIHCERFADFTIQKHSWTKMHQSHEDSYHFLLFLVTT